MTKAFLLIWLGTLASLSASPQISVVGLGDIDFGTYPANESKQAQFVIRNIGDTVLSITGLRVTCDCATVDISTKKIFPGKDANLSLKVAGNELAGQFDRKIYILSDDPKNRCMALTFSGNAKPIGRISPSPEVYLGTLAVTETMQYRFKLRMTEPDIILGTPMVKAEIPVNATIIKVSEQEFDLTLIANDLKAAPSRFTIEVVIPINQPTGWAPLKVTLTGRIK